jgi:hypothetical protein
MGPRRLRAYPRPRRTEHFAVIAVICSALPVSTRIELTVPGPNYLTGGITSEQRTNMPLFLIKYNINLYNCNHFK